jgi:CheY-like chemotaxis protein
MSTRVSPQTGLHEKDSTAWSICFRDPTLPRTLGTHPSFAYAAEPSVLSDDQAGTVNSMTDARLLVSVVDDDESVRESLPDLLREMGFAARAFSSPEEFLESDAVLQTECLILDIAMPGMAGPELQRELKRRQIPTPIIFITAHQDERVRRSTVDEGAVECLLKPFTDTALLEALNTAFRIK